MSSANQSDYHKTALRLPRDLYAELIDAAQRNGHSMNAEIIARLSAYQTMDAKFNEIGRQNTEIKGLVKKILDAVADK